MIGFMDAPDDSPDLAGLLGSWELALRAERKAPATITGYKKGVLAFLKWCEANEIAPVLSKTNVTAFTAYLLDEGREANTVKSRQLGIRRFSSWLAEEGELPDDPLFGLKAPKVDSKVIEPLTDEELRALLKACAGKEFRDRRDIAIVRLMLETGMRAGEVVNMEIDALDLSAQTAIIRRGKGGKGRMVPFGPQAAMAIDRYIRQARNKHRLKDTPPLWLGERGRNFGYAALHYTLDYRARRAGISGFHPHRMRHTAAHRWLAAGGSEGGLMAVAGWSSPEMLKRYTNARAADRAAAEARNLNFGDCDGQLGSRVSNANGLPA